MICSSSIQVQIHKKILCQLEKSHSEFSLTLPFVFFLHLSFEGIIWGLSSLGTATCSIQSVDSTITCLQAQSLSGLTAIPWTAACQTPLSMGFLWQEYWNGLPFPSPWPRDRTHVSWVSCSHTGRQILYHCVTWEAHIPLLISFKKKKKKHPHRHTNNNV